MRRHRLQFFLHLGHALPTDFVDHFTMPGRRSVAGVFAHRARRYRLTHWIVIALMVAFGLGGLAAVKLPVPEDARLWIALSSVALLPLAVLIHIVNLWLRCPSCSKA